MAEPNDKVQAGFFSFTEITDPKQHVAYNEWHQLDHMPEQLPMHGIVHGQRWVRTPACAAAASVAVAPFDAVHYLTLYLMADPVGPTLGEFFDLGRALGQAGRFFDARRSHFARPLAIDAAVAPDRVLISANAVPYRPHRGIYVIVEHHNVDDSVHAMARVDRLRSLVAIEGVSGAWSFRSDERFAGSHWDVGNYVVTVAWLDGAVLPTAASIDHALGGGETERTELFTDVVFRGPFMTITAWEWNWFEGAPE